VEVIVEKIVEKLVEVEVPMIIEKIVEIEKLVEIEKIVEAAGRSSPPSFRGSPLRWSPSLQG